MFPFIRISIFNDKKRSIWPLNIAIENIAIYHNYHTYNSFTKVYYFSSPVMISTSLVIIQIPETALFWLKNFTNQCWKFTNIKFWLKANICCSTYRKLLNFGIFCNFLFHICIKRLRKASELHKMSRYCCLRKTWMRYEQKIFLQATVEEYFPKSQKNI